MNAPDDGTIVLATTRTAFEAEAIAAALRDRGIIARTADTASASLFGGPISKARVLVPAAQQLEARAALRDIEAQAQEIDWSSVDVGTPPPEVSAAFDDRGKSRRWAWTLVVLLVPTGTWVLIAGVQRADVIIQALASMLLFAAIAIASYLLFARGGGQFGEEWGDDEN